MIFDVILRAVVQCVQVPLVPAYSSQSIRLADRSVAERGRYLAPHLAYSAVFPGVT